MADGMGAIGVYGGGTVICLGYFHNHESIPIAHGVSDHIAFLMLQDHPDDARKFKQRKCMEIMGYK